MDRNRQSEVRTNLLRLGRKYGCDAVIPDRGDIDWELVFDEATDVDRKPTPRIGVLRDRVERDHLALLRFEFETDDRIGHSAGQYFSIRYRGRARAYSIASSPNRPGTERCIRRFLAGGLSPQLRDDLSVGETLHVRGPHGHLLLEDASNRDKVFLATGTGVAPMKSMIDYLFEEGRDESRGATRDVWRFLGAAWMDDLPYHVAFLELAAEHDNFHYVPCLSREPWITDWYGETEYIQDAMLIHVDERA